MDELIDTHHHLWILGDGADYPWLKPGAPLSHNGKVDAIRRDYTIDDYRADMQGVRLVGSVHVEAGRSPDQALDETRWVQSIIDRHDLPSAIVANVDVWSPEFRTELERHRRFPAQRGVRVRLNTAGQPLASLGAEALRIEDDAWSRACAALADHELRLELQVTPAMARGAAALAAKYPAVRMAAIHAGFPFDRTPEGLNRWTDGLKLLAEQPNIYLKVSGIGMTDHRWTDQSMIDIVQRILAVYPTDRIMLGSNLPVDRLYASPERLLGTMLAALSGLDPEARRMVMAGTARAFYRLRQ